ncbi:MAG: hypothetical protein IH822_12265, partial [Chloroflexi bacterium]|nr:hypothetical protein [Chloroflexota bacterium]
SDIGDIVLMAGLFAFSVPPAPVRLDMAPSPPFGPDGFVDFSDIVRLAGFFGAKC